MTGMEERECDCGRTYRTVTGMDRCPKCAMLEKYGVSEKADKEDQNA